jgi:hypothetical protein
MSVNNPPVSHADISQRCSERQAQVELAVAAAVEILSQQLQEAEAKAAEAAARLPPLEAALEAEKQVGG